MPKIYQVLNWATKKLRKAKIDSANLDAEVLLIASLRQCLRQFTPAPIKTWIYTHPEFELSKAQEKKYKKYIARRAKGEPVAYILGHKEFFGLDFLVNKNVLIPRPETELMAEEVLKDLRFRIYDLRETLLIDVGTGSGCIPIAVAKSLIINHSSLIPKIIATDISIKTLAMAKKNAKLHGLEKKIKFIKSDLLGGFKIYDLRFKNKKNTKIIITANLPYLPDKIYKENYTNLKFEPRQALLAKNNGLALYEKLLKQIKQSTINSQQLTIILEILPIQKSTLYRLIKKRLPRASVKFKKDLAGQWRLAIIEIKIKDKR